MSEPGQAQGQVRRIDLSTRRLFALALPMTLANVTQPLIGLVDMAAIGRLGDVALLGAVAIGAILFDILFGGLGALRLSTAGLTAQAHGAGRDDQVALVIARALLIALVLGLGLIVLQRPIMALAFWAFQPGEGVREAAEAYIAIRIWSAPFALANFAVLGSLIGRGRTDLGLALQVFINLTKAGLTLVTVTLFGLGIAGAAFATLAAEIMGACIGLVVIARVGGLSRATWHSRELLEGGAIRRTLAVNRDVAIRTLALLCAFAFFTAQGARAGDVTLAANAVLNNLFLLGAFFLDGFATAAEQLCGQALGSRDERGFRATTRLAMRWSLGVALFVSLAILFGGAVFIDFVSTNPDVREAARTDLIFAALTPVAGAAAFVFDGVFIGATWTKAMRNMMLVAVTLFLGTFMVTRGLGNAGLWISLLAFLAMRGLGQALLYPHLLAATFPRSPSGVGQRASSGKLASGESQRDRTGGS